MKRIRIDWRQMAEGLCVSYANCPSDDDVLGMATSRARRWADGFMHGVRDALSDEEMDALEAESRDIVRCHWSPDTVLPALLDMPAIVGKVNRLCREAPPPDGRTLAHGDGLISWREEPGGVRFGVAPPLLRGYVAALHGLGRRDDGAQLRELGSDDLVLTMRRACGPVTLDLGGWELELAEPDPEEVFRYVSRRRSRAARSA